MLSRLSNVSSLRQFIGLLMLRILGKTTILKLSLTSTQSWKWALFTFLRPLSPRIPRLLRFGCLDVLLGTFLLYRLLLLLLLTSEDAWLLGWYPSICDLHLALEIFNLNDFSFWISDLLGLLLDSWVCRSVWSLPGYIGRSHHWVTSASRAGLAGHLRLVVEVVRAS